ncbi:thiamine pyrophosphate-dependent dehydrogenase E1 component subunit alpha [Natronomonas halophila]|uniref:thiamine pyrophosphate-dependent dehydrogenase E1 component subunit alpha n=1 Tax=Natronomonas halophila TaxID=2747817 RepID=UPI0015B7843D|nr:thiamine pyrophosphate-dependent dehydrogenase E1 component subunit alpha [Natronomonas halophila]QLD84228.1 thiamine pyrophosphate-dependent dehydrogenase E1 component subunit alpha [Natronomonas halophila]
MVSESNPDVDDLPRETADVLLDEMMRIRAFDDAALEQFREGDVPGFLHLCHGHEASHAGMGVAMAPDDWLAVGGSRLHGQYLVKGVPMPEAMAEIYGKETGPNRGKGGSMHLADYDRHLYGHAATIGSGQNPAAGIALAQQMRETGNVVVSTIGDGGTSRGSFHTALVFAATWDLPVVYVIENNEFAISYDAENLPIEQLSDYGEPLDMPTESVDGSDPVAVHEAVSAAVDRARSGGGPTVIESRVTRMRGHFEGDKQQYRTETDADASEADPLTSFRDRLIEAGHITAAEYDDRYAEFEAKAREAVEFAQESDFPDSEVAYDDIYEEPLYGQEGGDR